ISEGSFVRIDFENIRYVIEAKDYVYLSTKAGVYKPNISIDKIKELLPCHQFIWINETTAILRVSSSHNR
ncbi:MAG: LytTR family transcriptional regulator DNA-binding domain-containing protein, partial [Chitinophagaceae bacterium]